MTYTSAYVANNVFIIFNTKSFDSLDHRLHVLKTLQTSHMCKNIYSLILLPLFPILQKADFMSQK